MHLMTCLEWTDFVIRVCRLIDIKTVVAAPIRASKIAELSVFFLFAQGVSQVMIGTVDSGYQAHFVM